MLQEFRSLTSDFIIKSMITQELCMMTLAQDLPMQAASGHVHTHVDLLLQVRQIRGGHVLGNFITRTDRGDIQRSEGQADLKGWRTIV